MPRSVLFESAHHSILDIMCIIYLSPYHTWWCVRSAEVLMSSSFCSMLRFRLVPFLTELRAVMDWVWTDTTLSLSSWICVEDIYAHIFVLKCWRESEKVRHQRLVKPAFRVKSPLFIKRVSQGRLSHIVPLSSGQTRPAV